MRRLGSGDVLVWCGSPDVLRNGERLMLLEPAQERGYWSVVPLDAKDRPAATFTVYAGDLVTEEMWAETH